MVSKLDFVLPISDNMQMDLTNLGADELLRYDFGHCSVSKVGEIRMFIDELGLFEYDLDL